jgi:hypothetical protein
MFVLFIIIVSAGRSTCCSPLRIILDRNRGAPNLTAPTVGLRCLAPVPDLLLPGDSKATASARKAEACCSSCSLRRHHRRRRSRARSFPSRAADPSWGLARLTAAIGMILAGPAHHDRVTRGLAHVLPSLADPHERGLAAAPVPLSSTALIGGNRRRRGQRAGEHDAGDWKRPARHRPAWSPRRPAQRQRLGGHNGAACGTGASARARCIGK